MEAKKHMNKLRKYNKYLNNLYLIINIALILISFITKNSSMGIYSFIAIILSSYAIVVRLLFKLKIDYRVQLISSFTIFAVFTLGLGLNFFKNQVFSCIIQILLCVIIFAYSLIIFHHMYYNYNRIKNVKRRQIERMYMQIPIMIKSIYGVCSTVTVITFCMIIKYFILEFSTSSSMTGYQVVFHIFINMLFSLAIGLIYHIYCLIRTKKYLKLEEGKSSFSQSGNIEIKQTLPEEKEETNLYIKD